MKSASDTVHHEAAGNDPDRLALGAMALHGGPNFAFVFDHGTQLWHRLRQERIERLEAQVAAQELRLDRLEAQLAQFHRDLAEAQATLAAWTADQ